MSLRLAVKVLLKKVKLATSLADFSMSISSCPDYEDTVREHILGVFVNGYPRLSFSFLGKSRMT